MELNEIIKENAHALVAGTTGAGKSQVVKNFLIDGLMDSLAVVIDLKKIELSDFRDCARVKAYADTPTEAVELLEDLNGLMDRRYNSILNGSPTHGARFFIVIDELADLIATCGKDAIKPLARLARLARAADMHLLLATQSPARRNLPAEIIQNIPCRVALRCIDSIESRQVIGTSGAERLPMYGSALVRAPQFIGVKRIDGLQVADDEKIKKTIREINLFERSVVSASSA